MFSKSTALPKSYIILPCFPAVCSIVSRSQSLHQGLASFSFLTHLLHLLFTLFFRFTHVCLSTYLSLFLSSPHASSWARSSKRGVLFRATEMLTGCLILRVSSQALPNASANAWTFFPVSSLALTPILFPCYPASIFC